MRIAIDRRAVAALATVAVLLAATACTQTGQSQSADASVAASSGTGGTTVVVALQEWAVVPQASSAPAGDVTFEITNSGPADVHEFVVVKTDLEPGALPTDANGAVDESGGDIEVIGEIEDVAVDATEQVTLTLEAGSYVLLCNIYDDTEGEAHYAEGMRIAFTVT